MKKKPDLAIKDSFHFDLEIHHGGYLEKIPSVKYVDGRVDNIIDVEASSFCFDSLQAMVEKMGYKDVKEIYFRIPGKSLDEGLNVVYSQKDVFVLLMYAEDKNVIEIYLDGGVRDESVRLEDFVINNLTILYEGQDEYDYEGQNEYDDDYLCTDEEASDVASLDHLSEGEEEVIEVRKKKIELRKSRRLKKRIVESDLVQPLDEEALENVCETEQNEDVCVPYTGADGYNTEYDSSDYDSPQEDEDGELVEPTPKSKTPKARKNKEREAREQVEPVPKTKPPKESTSKKRVARNKPVGQPIKMGKKSSYWPNPERSTTTTKNKESQSPEMLGGSNAKKQKKSPSGKSVKSNKPPYWLNNERVCKGSQSQDVGSKPTYWPIPEGGTKIATRASATSPTRTRSMVAKTGNGAKILGIKLNGWSKK